MAPGSKPPSTHQSRQPLSSRIRASFEGKRSKSVNKAHSRANSLTEEFTSPTADSNGSPVRNGLLSSPGAHDADTLRSAIDQAINSDAFQGAIASHLAKLIKPSIKSALDTIQPLVEAVYTHELLLRKTNQNVENALERMETNASKRNSRADFDEGEVAAVLAEPGPRLNVSALREIAGSESKPDLDQFKGLLEASHAQHKAALAGLSSSVGANNSKIAEVAEGVAEIKTSLGSSVEEWRAASEESKTTISVLQAQLDQLKTDVTHILEAVGSNLEKNVQAIHERGVAEPDTSFLAEHTTKLDAISTDIAALKPLEAQVAAINSTLEAHSVALDEIKTVGTSHVAALEGHGAALENIRLLNGSEFPNEGAGLANLEAQVSAIVETLQTHTSALEELKGTTSSHATAFAERSIDSPRATESGNFSTLETQIGSLSSTLESHGSILDEIKTTSGSHGAILDEIKNAHTIHTSALDEIKAKTLENVNLLEEIRSPGLPPSAPTGGIQDISNLAALEIQIGSVVNTLSTHTSALADIGARVGASNAALLVPGSETTPQDDLNTVMEILDAHSAILNEIKEDVSAEILTALHNVDQKQENMSSLLVEIRESDLSDEVLTLLHGVGENASSHAATLESIRETIQASHGNLEEIKSKSIDPDHVNGILAGLEEHKASLAAIQEQTTALHGLQVVHTSSLDEIKSRSIDTSSSEVQPIVHIERLETQVGSIISVLEEQKTVLSELKDMTSGFAETHTVHASILSDIKDGTAQSNESHSSHAAILSELKAIPTTESPDLSAIEAHLTTILTTLESQTETLSSLKESTNTSVVHDTVKQFHDLIATNHELLTSHTAILGAIKEGDLTTHEELKSLLLESKSGIDTHSELVKDLHSSTTESHSSLMTAIAALAVGGAAGAGTTALLSRDDDDEPLSSEVLAEVKAVRAIVESSKENIESIKNQIDINHTTITTSLSALGDEVKSEIDASGTGVGEKIEAMHGDFKAIDISSLQEKLDQHGSGLAGITTQLEEIDRGVRAIDLTSIHTTLETHGSGINGLVTHLEGVDTTVKTLDLAPLHEKLDQYASTITGISTQLEDVHESVKAVDLSPVHEKLDQHSSDVQALGTHLETFDLNPVHAALELHGAGIDGIYSQLESIDGNVIGLLAGVHLSDAGLGQLQSNVIKRKISRPSMSEGAWFKRDRSVSPLLERSNVVEEEKEHSSIPVVLGGVVAGGALIGGAAALLSKDDVDDKLPEDAAPPIECIEKGEPIEARGLDELTKAEVPNSSNVTVEDIPNQVPEPVEEVQHSENEETVLPTNEHSTDPIEEIAAPPAYIIEPEAESQDTDSPSGIQSKMEEVDDFNIARSEALPEDPVDSPVEAAKEPIEESKEAFTEVAEDMQPKREVESQAVEHLSNDHPGSEASVPEEVVEEAAPEPIEAETGIEIHYSGEVEEEFKDADPSLSPVEDAQVQPESGSHHAEAVLEQELEGAEDARVTDSELSVKDVVESSKAETIGSAPEIDIQPEAEIPEAIEPELESDQIPAEPSENVIGPSEGSSLEAVKEVHAKPDSVSPDPEATEVKPSSEAKEAESIKPDTELPQTEGNEAKEVEYSDVIPDTETSPALKPITEPASTPKGKSIKESKEIDSEPEDSSLKDEFQPEVGHPAPPAENEALKEVEPNETENPPAQIGKVSKEDDLQDLTIASDPESKALGTQPEDEEVDVIESDDLPKDVLEGKEAVERTEADSLDADDGEISPVAEAVHGAPILDETIVKEESDDLSHKPSVTESKEDKQNAEFSHDQKADHESNDHSGAAEESASKHDDSVEVVDLRSSEPGQDVSDSSVVETQPIAHNDSIVQDSLAHSETADTEPSRAEPNNENINDSVFLEQNEVISKDQHEEAKIDSSSIDADEAPLEHVKETFSALSHEIALPNEPERVPHTQDADETSPIEHEQGTDNVDSEVEEKPEGALSPIPESPVTDSGLGVGVEDPFSDAQISESHVPPPQHHN